MQSTCDSMHVLPKGRQQYAAVESGLLTDSEDSADLKKEACMAASTGCIARIEL